MLTALFVRPAFNRSHRFVCRDNPDGKSGPEAVAQIYGPDVDARAALFAAAPDLEAACQAVLDEFPALDGKRIERVKAICRAALEKAKGAQ